jgi:uncharacterized membrane protein YbjE (DUF340 family)
MWIILILLLSGSIAGFFLGKFRGFNRATDKISLYIIYILLFFMGLSVGTRPEVMKNLGRIGLDAFLIAVFAIAGSIFAAYFLYRFNERKK